MRPCLQPCSGSLFRQQNCLSPRQHSHENHQILCLAIVSENSGRRNISSQLASWYNNPFVRLGADCGLHWATPPGGRKHGGQIKASSNLASLVLVTGCVCQRKESSSCNLSATGSTYPAFTEVLCVLERAQSLLLFSLPCKHCEHIYSLFYSFSLLFQMLTMTLLAVVKEFHFCTISLMGCILSGITIQRHIHYIRPFSFIPSHKTMPEETWQCRMSFINQLQHSELLSGFENT